MRILKLFEVMDHDKGKQVTGKVTLIDAQLRFVREVDGSIEHVTWFIDVDRLTDFMQEHFTKQTH
ncbi:hypothetical protein [Exiguobacterium sp. 9-2]|uniref:hypothetical protein n=1 Tax=Exiguobacterium sp. 9-2 TaxID=3112419 RepID=UPI002E343090|nr:hypothetical protein [Exiguobacterium sp. 9-2]